MREAEGTALTNRQHYWLDHVQACVASGKTIAEYAAEHELAAQAMYAGKKMLVKKGALPPTGPARFQRAQSVAQVSRDTGVSEQTLYNWRNLRRPWSG